MIIEIYLLGCAIALGSATAAILRGEPGFLWRGGGVPPLWFRVLEVLLAGVLSWYTVGFCQVMNAYRSAGKAEWTCGGKK